VGKIHVMGRLQPPPTSHVPQSTSAAMKSTPSVAALLAVELPKQFPYRCAVPWCNKSYEKATWYRRHVLDQHPGFRHPQPQAAASDAAPDVVEPLMDGAELPTSALPASGDDDYEDYDDNEEDSDSDRVVELNDLFNSLGLNSAEFWHNPELVPPPLPNGPPTAPTAPAVPTDSDSDSSERVCDGAGQGTPLNDNVFETLEHPWAPFADEEDYRLAEWFVESKTPATYIDSFFKTPTGRRAAERGSFKSNYKLRQLINEMTDGLSLASWKLDEIDVRTASGRPEKLQFYHREPLDVIRWLIGQPANAEHLVYAPVQQYAGSRRIYSEMHTADWWWETQVGR